MADLGVLEARVWSLLEPYRDELEEATIYGMPCLRWPGAGAHDYFAAVQRSTKKVSLYAVAVDRWPETLDEAAESFLRCRTGKATFSFPALDDDLADELSSFLSRLFRVYRAHHVETDPEATD